MFVNFEHMEDVPITKMLFQDFACNQNLSHFLTFQCIQKAINISIGLPLFIKFTVLQSKKKVHTKIKIKDTSILAQDEQINLDNFTVFLN